MSVTPRGDAWQAQVNHQGQRYRRQFATKKEAAQWEADSRARLLRDETPEAGGKARGEAGRPQTLAELIDHVYNTHWAPMAGGSKALLNAQLIAAHIGPSRLLTRIGSLEVDKARAALLKDGNAPSTVNRKVAALSKALSIAKEAGLIEKLPRLAKYREAEHRIRRFTPTEEAQAAAFFQHIGSDVMVDYLHLSLDTGLRQGELLAARYRDANGVKVTVWGTGAKSGHTRSVPLTARAKGIIERRKADAKAKDSDFILGGVNRWAVSHYWERLSGALDMEDDAQFVPHILRHEFCSRLADRNLNAAVIKELAGHSSLSVTQRYIHIGAQALVDAIAALEVVPPRAPEPVAEDILGD